MNLLKIAALTLILLANGQSYSADVLAPPVNPGIIKEHLTTLGLDAKATQDDIRKAYKILTRKEHPDKHGNSSAAQEKFKSITRAYTFLKGEDYQKYLDHASAAAALLASRIDEEIVQVATPQEAEDKYTAIISAKKLDRYATLEIPYSTELFQQEAPLPSISEVKKAYDRLMKKYQSDTTSTYDKIRRRLTYDYYFLEANYKALTMNPYEILGLPEGTSFDKIQQIIPTLLYTYNPYLNPYFQWHPEKHAFCYKIQQKISDAYKDLKKAYLQSATFKADFDKKNKLSYYNQQNLILQIIAYLEHELAKAEGEEIINRKEVIDNLYNQIGFCGGLTTLWLFAEYTTDQEKINIASGKPNAPGPRDDMIFFDRARELLLLWSPETPLNKEDADIIERFIAFLRLFQNFSNTFFQEDAAGPFIQRELSLTLQTAQGTSPQLIKKMDHVKQLSKEELITFLQAHIKPASLIFVEAQLQGSGLHVVGLYQSNFDKTISFFDANYDGKLPPTFDSTQLEALAYKISQAFGCNAYGYLENVTIDVFEFSQEESTDEPQATDDQKLLEFAQEVAQDPALATAT